MSSSVNVMHRRALAVTVIAIALFAATLPTARAADATFTITGAGYGHGIGMSQWGAQGFARQGRSYTWILQHYFQGTSVTERAATTVRVNLDPGANYSSGSGSYNAGYTRTTWHVRPGYPGATLSLGTSTVRLPDLLYTFASSGGMITVTGSDGKVYGRYKGTVTVTPGPGAPPLLSVSEPTGHYGNTNKRYRGKLVLTANGAPIKNSRGTVTVAANHLKLVDCLAMEDYLRGVVPNESPSSWEADALKAQAVAARSYAYQSSGDLYCTTRSQVYRGFDYEAATTNNAVAATNGQVVVSGSTVVSTYFSSSSGGHTASIQDVWLSSTPRSYYSGVDDADSSAESGNPYATWSGGSYSGAALASKIRAGGVGYEVSPAVVTAVSVDRAASGFARHVTLTWSNGAKHTITGDDFRGALNLKSTKFYIATTLPATSPKRFEQSDSHIAYGGTWTTARYSALSGGTHAYSNTAGSRIFFSFKGTGVTWIGRTGPTYGGASVSIDGKTPVRVPCSSTSTIDRNTVWTARGLTSTIHTVQVIVDGAAPGTGRGYVSLDAIDVTGGSLVSYVPPRVRVEDTSAAISYRRSWARNTSSHLSGGSQRWSATTGAYATLTFEGTGATWIGNHAASYGKALVYVDGVLRKTVDEYARTTTYGCRLFTITGLKYGTHTLKIVVSASKNAASRGRTTALDAFDISGRTITP